MIIFTKRKKTVTLWNSYLLVIWGRLCDITVSVLMCCHYSLHASTVLWTQYNFWIFWIMNFSGFLIRVLLEAYNSTLLRILLVFILQDINQYVNLVIDIYCVYYSVAARRQVISSHGTQYVLVFSHFRLFEFRLNWIRVLDSVKCPSFFTDYKAFSATKGRLRKKIGL